MLQNATPSASSEAELAVFARILVPVDLAGRHAASTRAVRLALALERSLGSRVCVLQLAQYGQNSEFLGGLGNSSTPGDAEEFAVDRLNHLLENIEQGASKRATARALLADELVRGVMREVKRFRATLVILPNPPRDNILRSDEELLVRELDVPVLVAREG